MKSRSSKTYVSLALFSIITVLVLSACGGSPGSAQTVPGTISTSLPPVTTLPPTTKPTITPTTIPPTTIPSGPIDAAALFANNCERCHETSEIAPGVAGLNDAELAKFIGGHNTGLNLTDLQRSALAVYLKATVIDDG
jgi:hypothetical protein